MADVTPGIIHYSTNGTSICGVDQNWVWDEDDDAEFIWSKNINDVNCDSCLERIYKDVKEHDRG